EALLGLNAIASIAPLKVERLHAVARAALEGMLDRTRLRSLPEPEALQQLRTLPGIGEFFAQGILMRGAGLVDAVTDDELTARAIQLLYGLQERPDRAGGSPAGRDVATISDVDGGLAQRLGPQPATRRDRPAADSQPD